MLYKAKFGFAGIGLFSLLFSLCSFISVYPQQFHSLDGIEDNQGNTLLLYRLGEEFYPYNPIYKFNTFSQSESLIIQAYNSNFPGGQLAKAVWDFEFFPANADNFMNVGYEINPDNHGYIARNDSIVLGGFDGYWKVDISKQNPLKVFVFGGAGEIRSWDGGYTFPLDSIYPVTNFIPIALADFDDNVMFGFDEDLNFCRNGGVVDTSLVRFDEHSKLLYDVNQFHVYRVNYTYGGYSLNVSNNKGNAFTWTKTYQSENPIFITIDSTQTGIIYLADGRRIYKSVNNGYSFTEYKSFPSKIVGIYKKPNSEILYAASSSKIYKITPDSVTVIKSLPVPPEVLNYYPLAIGNYWIYNVFDWSYPYYSHDIYTRKVLSKETLSNNKEYFKIEEKSQSYPHAFYKYERIDSANGLVYRFDSECSNPNQEKVIDDFSAEVGDSIPIKRFTFCADEVLSFFKQDGIQNIFGASREFRTFEYDYLQGFEHTLVKDFGLFNISISYDFGNTGYTLKGCIINGIIYGDTTLTGVEAENNLTPTEYKLEQNFPNPFNPSTKISWQSPVGTWQTLKVFDVLGREVATLVDEFREAGTFEVEFDGSQLASGVYYYQLNVEDYLETRKMIFIK